MMGMGICYGGGIAHTLSTRCVEDEHDGAAKAILKQQCAMLCAWKGGGPCLHEHCPRRIQSDTAADCAEPSAMEIAQREADEAAGDADPRDIVRGSSNDAAAEQSV
jgi:hypothetical protein